MRGRLSGRIFPIFFFKGEIIISSLMIAGESRRFELREFSICVSKDPHTNLEVIYFLFSLHMCIL